MIARRGFLAGLGALLAAPTIVHAGNLMPISAKHQMIWLSRDGMLTITMSPHFRVGDIITFKGVHSVVRYTGQIRSDLRQFVVLQDGDVVHEHNIYPPMREDSHDQYRTVDAKPKDWLRVSKVGVDFVSMGPPHDYRS